MAPSTADSIITLRSGGAVAEIHPAIGGRLGQVDFGSGPLLRGHAPDLGWAAWGCYPLLPWSNRIPGGLLRFADGEFQLPVNWEDGSAIHGLAASCPWDVVSVSATTAELEVRVETAPYSILGRQRFDLYRERMTLSLSATNLGAVAVPAGIGIHPWFTAGPVRIPADAVWPGEPLPTGPPVPVVGDHDLRNLASPAPMDACFTSLTASSADVPGAVLRWDGPITNVVVYSGEPGWVCVEPVTMANDGFRISSQMSEPLKAGEHGVRVLNPGEVLEVQYRLIGVSSAA